eukprot:1598926-Rhodomonas_salina.1
MCREHALAAQHNTTQHLLLPPSANARARDGRGPRHAWARRWGRGQGRGRRAPRRACSPWRGLRGRRAPPLPASAEHTHTRTRTRAAATTRQRRRELR